MTAQQKAQRASASKHARSASDRRRYEYQSVKATNFDLFCVLSKLKEINDNTIKVGGSGSVVSITSGAKGGSVGTGIGTGDPEIEEYFHAVKGRNCLSLEEGRALLGDLVGSDRIPPPPRRQSAR